MNLDMLAGGCKLCRSVLDCFSWTQSTSLLIELPDITFPLTHLLAVETSRAVGYV